MGKFIHGKDVFKVNNGDLSNYCFNLDTPETKEQVDVSGFNPNASREFLPGQLDQTITAQLLQDFVGTASPHAILEPIFSSGTTCVVEVRNTSGTPSVTFGGTASLYEYNGLSGALNARGEITAVFKPANGAVWAWSTA